jgi:hypothetical protein
MSHERTTIDDTATYQPAAPGAPAPGATQDAAAQAPEVPVYEPIEDDEWPDEPAVIPPRPRRRLLGKGSNPVALALLGVLLCACGFIGGVLVEKAQNTSSSPATGSLTGLASRFRALRASAGAGAGATGGSSVSGSGFTRPTAGTVAYLAGSTLYVTNAEGNTVKVRTSPATSVSKTVKASVAGIHPGETVTVTVTGATAANGSVSAESISVGSSGGGLTALLGAGTGLGAGAQTGTSSAGPSLFGG